MRTTTRGVKVFAKKREFIAVRPDQFWFIGRNVRTINFDEGK